MAEASTSTESILRDANRMCPSDSFAFCCGADLDCFTHCCRDVSIVLTPYDVLRLKKALGVDSSEFLERHTLSLFTPPKGLPVVMLKMDEEAKSCPFVTERGCILYAHRPWACRMYPLGVAEPKTPTPADHRFHFLIREDLCHGHAAACRTTVGDWIAGQGIEEYEMMGASFKALTLHDFWSNGTPLTPEQAGMFYMACYDLDRFRRFVFDTRFLQLFEVDEARVEALRSDDEELLEFGMEWLRFVLFHDKTMKIRKTPQAPEGGQ